MSPAKICTKYGETKLLDNVKPSCAACNLAQGVEIATQRATMAGV